MIRNYQYVFSFIPSTPSRKRNPSGFISEVDDYISEPCTEMSKHVIYKKKLTTQF
jgi:hypothetical protein